MKFLKQSTAASVVVGPFVDKSDAVTAKTALGSQTGRIVKQGTGGSLTPASWSHDSSGYYLVGLSTAHTDTLGRLRISFTDAATYLPVWEDFMVLPAASYDALVAGTIALPVNLTQIDAQTTATGDASLSLKQITLLNESGGPALSITGGNKLLGYAAVEFAGASMVDDADALALRPRGIGVSLLGNLGGDVLGSVAGTVGGVLDGVNLAEENDVYHADIQFTRDVAHSRDEYTVVWFKNGARISGGIASPTIRVVRRGDGSDLIATAAMTAIGSINAFTLDATGSSRQTPGEAVIVVVEATINFSTRSFARVLGRDDG